MKPPAKQVSFFDLESRRFALLAIILLWSRKAIQLSAAALGTGLPLRLKSQNIPANDVCVVETYPWPNCGSSKWPPHFGSSIVHSHNITTFLLEKYCVMLSRVLLNYGVLTAGLLLIALAADSDNKIGFSGVLSSLDGGLHGTVIVQDPQSLRIQNYQLGDGGAPALYWWGSATSDLKSGFRIAGKQVTTVSAGSDLEVALDSGKTSADFITVGLWCERFGVNYGQTTLRASSPAGNPAASGSIIASSTSLPSLLASGSLNSVSSSSDTSSSLDQVAILNDPYNTARVYFCSVIGLLLLESTVYLPSYLSSILDKDLKSGSRISGHSRIYLLLLKACTYPLTIPGLMTVTTPDILRFAALLGLNILWGWNRNKFSADFDLYGWLTLANGGLALLFAARNNAFAILLRIPSSTILFYHRWVGRAAVVHATIHMANLIQSYIKTGQFSVVLQTLRIQVGLMAWISLWLMAIFSLSIFRRRCFELFYYLHALFILFIIGALIHATHAPEFLVPGLALWAVDRIIRFSYNFRPTNVIAVTYYPSNLTKFKIQGVAPHHPTQVAWLQFTGASLLNWHPFSFASPPSANGIATFAIRSQGNYTRRVQYLGGENVEKPNMTRTRQLGISIEEPRNLRVRVDGPYGVGKIQWGGYRVTVIVAGGSGLTPGLSIAGYLLDRSRRLAKQSNSSPQPSHLRILWVVKASNHILWFAEELVNLCRTAKDSSLPLTIDLAIHVTGIEAGRPLQGFLAQADFISYLSAHDNIHGGRPDIGEYFRGLRSQYSGSDVAVSVCGPQRLTDAVRREAVAGDWSTKGGGAYYVDAESFTI